MKPKATTVRQYLAALPPERREALQAVRRVILANLDKDYEEGIQYGMIGYYVPHRVYPAGYHCDPKQPLPMACLGSQKNHMSLHLMTLYGWEGAGAELLRWFKAAWGASGRKLDMGKACIRFRKLDDVALEVIGEVVRRVPARAYVAQCEAALQDRASRTSKARAAPARTARAKTAGRAPAARKRPKAAAGRKAARRR
ncbi:MAG: DUF1801 domain-containing protein [Phycisphaerae bacterium]|nr:DUF1801 domain-containing protein [Phycisphaerae bacterium]MCZ2398386.1 DUF1801 domain-containing protein [Phycisphaerae bacterium]